MYLIVRYSFLYLVPDERVVYRPPVSMGHAPVVGPGTLRPHDTLDLQKCENQNAHPKFAV